MKTIKRHTISEDCDIPMGKQWFAKFENIGDKLRIYGYEHLGIPHTFTFETEYGTCACDGNPLWVITKGYFLVRIPLGADETTLYCADKRIIATLMKSNLGMKEGKHDGTGVFDIVDEVTANDIYEKNKIPSFTVR